MAVAEFVNLNSSVRKEPLMDGRKRDDVANHGLAVPNACCKELSKKLDKSESGREKLRQAIFMLKEKLEAAENVLQVNDASKNGCEKAQQHVETERGSLEEDGRLQNISEQEGKSLKEELFCAIERIFRLENNKKEDRIELKRLQEVKEIVGLVRVAVKHMESAQCSLQSLDENISAKVNDVSAQSLKSYSLVQNVLSTASSAQMAAKKAEATVLSVQKQTQSLSCRLGNLQKQGTRLEQSVTFLRQHLQKKSLVNEDEAFRSQAPTQHAIRHVSKGMVLSKNQCNNDESSIGADKRPISGSFIEVIPGISSILNPVFTDNAAKPSANVSQKSSMLSSESNVLDLECSSKWDTIKCTVNTKGTQDSIKDLIDLKAVHPSMEHCSRKKEAMCCPKVLSSNGNHCTKPIEIITTNQTLTDVCKNEINAGSYLANQASPIALLGSLTRLFKKQKEAQHKIKANLANLKKIFSSCPANMCSDNQHQYSSKPIPYTSRKRGAVDRISSPTEKQEHRGTFVVEGKHKDKKRRKENNEMIPDDGQENGLFRIGLEEKITELNIPKQGSSKEHEDDVQTDRSIQTLEEKVMIGVEEPPIQYKKEVTCIMEDIQKIDRTSEQYRDRHDLVVRTQKDEVRFEKEATKSAGNGDVLFAQCNENQSSGTSFRPSDLCCNLFEYRGSDWETDSVSSDEEIGETFLADLPVLLSPGLPVIPPPGSGMVLHTAGYQDCNMDPDEDLR